MKLLLLFAVLLGMGVLLPSYAQQVPTSGAYRLTHADSVATLHRLFQRNRRGGRITGLLEAALLPSVIVGAANPNPSAGKLVAGTQILSATIIAGYFVGNLVRWSRYSQRREREAVEQLEQHSAQRPYVQHNFERLLVAAAQPPRRSPFNKRERP